MYNSYDDDKSYKRFTRFAVSFIIIVVIAVIAYFVIYEKKVSSEWIKNNVNNNTISEKITVKKTSSVQSEVETPSKDTKKPDFTQQTSQMIELFQNDNITVKINGISIPLPCAVSDLSSFVLDDEKDGKIKAKSQKRINIYNKSKSLIGNVLFENDTSKEKKIKDVPIVGINVFDNGSAWSFVFQKSVGNIFRYSKNTFKKIYGKSAIEQHGWLNYYIYNNKKIMIYAPKNRVYGIDIYWNPNKEETDNGT